MAINIEFTEPGTPPSSADATNFRTRADSFVAWIAIFVTKLIAFVAQINSTEANINDKEASAVAASQVAVGATNYQGDWVAGSYSKGQSVSKSGFRYVSKINANTDTPPSINWEPIGTKAEIANVIHNANSANPTDLDEFGYLDIETGILNKLTWSNLVAQLWALISPVGKIEYFAMNQIPAGYLKANGAAVSRTAYANLFSAIGTTYGAGNGSTTFNLPDLRGEFIRGFDDGRGIDSGRKIGSNQADDFKSHTHGVPNDTANAGTANLSSGGVTTRAYITSQATGGNETRPRNIALLACIKY